MGAACSGLNDAVDGDDEPDAILFERLAGPFDGAARDALGTLYTRHAPALRVFLSRFGRADGAQRENWVARSRRWRGLGSPP